jgi:hypothetical protein
MSDFSIFGRILRLALSIAAPVGWLYFAPFHKLFATPFGLATLGYAIWTVVWLILIIPCGTVSISLLYMAITGRDSVRLWGGSS